MIQAKLELPMQHKELPSFNIEIKGDPQTKDRPRARIVRMKGNRPDFISFYNTSAVEKEEERIRQLCHFRMNSLGLIMFVEAVAVELEFYVPIPKSFSVPKRKEANDGWLLPKTRPDIDNYVKLVLDAMNQVVYHDDNLIVDLVCKKRYSDRTGTIVRVKEIIF